MLRIMVYRHSAFYSPLVAAIAGGFLKNEGLVAAYFPKPPRSLYDMFRKGDVDIMQAAVSTSWDPLSKGIRDIPVHFAQINQRDGFFITARRSGSRPFEWSDLEGARFLADHAQQPFAMLKYALHLKHVDASRVEFINAGPPEEMEKAFRQGTGDYIHLQGPAPQQLEKDGIGTVVACAGDVIPPVAFSSLMATREFLMTPEARAFKRAYQAAIRWVNDADAKDIAERESSFFPGVSIESVTAAITSYQKLGTWRPDPEITREQYEMAMDIFLHSGVFTERYAYDEVVVPFNP